LFFGLGASFLWQKGKVFKGVCLVLLVLSLFFAWRIVQPYFYIDNPSLVVAGNKANEILPKDAKVIAPYNGDTTLLYYINRPGWPAMQDSIPNLEKLGANYMVIVNPTKSDFGGYGKEYKVVASSKEYLILKLN
jgi:hypothetical protein